ncbi:MAG TPA: endolytic transglycosylase MltG [Patescibacteria group bacterium]|nr:endolytic transglycosylase MltG [Patescibacteria group bacterium]
MKKRLGYVIAAACLLIVLVGTVIGVSQWYKAALQPRSNITARISIDIIPGSTPSVIARQLEKSGVIKSAFAFEWLVKSAGDQNSLQAGQYLFSPTQSSREILDWLARGKFDVYNVTIYPGKTLIDIKKQLIKSGYLATDIDAAFSKTYNNSILSDKPAGQSLEGYILPETYQVNSTSTVEQLLSRAFEEFNKLAEEAGLKQTLAARGFSFYQGLTLASIVQQEAATESDQRQVAQVFEKRLAENISLGSDVTFVYAAQLLGQPASPSLDSPYNTRIYKGLPPGPIANVTLQAIKAVANPAPGDYLYFVAGDDGIIHFARTADEHDANIKRYCTKLCGG